MKRTRVNRAVISISGKKFGKGVTEIVSNKGGDDVIVSLWNDEEVASSSHVEVILPARTGMGAGLGVSRRWHQVFFVCFQCSNLLLLIQDLAVKNHC